LKRGGGNSLLQLGLFQRHAQRGAERRNYGVRVEETLAIESAFSGGLRSDKRLPLPLHTYSPTAIIETSRRFLKRKVPRGTKQEILPVRQAFPARSLVRLAFI
jgi:hypothetical protein